jgi:hypothetical protein
MDAAEDDVQLGVTDHLAGSPVTGHGYLTGPGLVEEPVTYNVVDGHAIHDGCIDLGPVEEVAAEADRIAAEHEVRDTTYFAGEDPGHVPDDVELGIGLPANSSFLWTNARVAYQVATGVPNQARIDNAIAHIEENTGIRFVRRTTANASGLRNFIEILSNGSQSWSSSAVGMRGGRQELRLADGHPWPILVHEFLHALGVYHEQSRSDRDDFVDIKWDNIQDGPPPAGAINALGNFQKKPGATDYFDYDFGSLMHYHRTAFAKDTSKPTIVPRRAGVTIGQRNGLSFGDRQTIAKMYERFFTKGYAGVWRSGSGKYGLWANATWPDFVAKWQEWSGQGMRLVDLHVRQTAAGPRFSGVFLPGSGAYGLWANQTWASFQAKWQEWSAQGLRLRDLHVHQVNGQNRYSGVFLAGSGGHGLWANQTWASFQAKWQEWSTKGLRIHDLHVHEVNGQNRYSGVFLAGSGGHGLWANATWADFVAKWQQWSGQGLRLVDMNLHRQSNGQNRYSGVFLPGTGGYHLWANVTWESFRAKWQELAGQGLRLVDFEFVNPPTGVLLDSADVGEGAEQADAAGVHDELEAFGGIFEAMVPAAVGSAVGSDEGGGSRHDGAPDAATAADDTDGGGGMDLPELDLRATVPNGDPGAGDTGNVEDGAAGLGGIDLGGGEPAGLPAEATGYGGADLQ